MNRRSPASGTSNGTSAGSAGASQMTPRRSRTAKAGGPAETSYPSRRSIQFRPSRRTCSHPPGRSSRDSATGCQACSSEGSRLPNTGPRGAVGAGARSGTGVVVGGGGDSSAVRSGASHTQPCRSSSAHGIARSARGGGVPVTPSEGMSTQRPSESKRQPCAGHCRRPSVTVAVRSGTSRCGQRAGKALTSPPGCSRTTTYARSPAATGSGVVPTSAAGATAYQPVPVDPPSAMTHCSARKCSGRYAHRAFSRHGYLVVTSSTGQ
jgi:hypothetical protein